MATTQFLLLSFVIAGMVVIPTNAQHDHHFPNCLLAMHTIKSVVSDAIDDEKRMGASLLRMHFHDCFVQGCDGSILLDDIPGNFTGEKTAFPNVNSVRGFEIIDKIKTEVDKVCGVGKVSCADILAVAARDSIEILGGPHYDVIVGIKDSTTASFNLANANLPPPFFSLSQLITNFQAQGLNLADLVALSGAHTIGKGQCINFRSRIYNAAEDINQNYRMSLQNICPSIGGDTNLTGIDVTSENSFDTAYYRNLLVKKGLFHSDQELYKGDGSAADASVTTYAQNYLAFKNDFVNAMTKMGNIGILTGNQGEIRNNCRVINS